MNIDSCSEEKKTRFFYIGAAVLLTVFFLLLLFRTIETTFHEHSLWWMIPTLSHIADNNSFLETIKVHLFNPYPTCWGEPSMNLYLFFILAIFGFQTKYFIFISLIVHFCSALLLYLLIRKIGFGFRIAFFSALVFAFSFIHFHYYMWGSAAQHLVFMFFLLLVMYLYLETSERMDRKKGWRGCFRLTLFVNFLASFCQIAILVLPISVLAHILICSKDGKDRIRKYDIWLPLFITYLGYPLIRNFYYGYVHLHSYLQALPANLLARMQIVKFNSPAFYPVIFALAIGGLILFRVILRLYDKYRIQRIFKYLLIAAIILYLFMLLSLYAKNQFFDQDQSGVSLFDFISPYNIARPLVGIFASFLEPLRTALSSNPAKPYHYIPMRNDILFFAISLLFMLLFFKKYFMKYKGVIIFFVFCIFTSRKMVEILLGGTQNSIPSRYFVYVTPFFSLIFCSVSVYLYDLLTSKIRVKNLLKNIILLFIFICMLVPNILAIKFEIFKGRLINTLLIYDYIRTAKLIKDDLMESGDKMNIDSSKIYLIGVLPMPFNELGWDYSPVNPQRFDTFRYTFAQILNEVDMLGVNVNRLPEEDNKGKVYAVTDSAIVNAEGVSIGPFFKNFDKGVKELRLKHYKKASRLFQKAIEKKPFFLNYVLAGYSLEDSEWIINKRSMRKWVSDMGDHYSSRPQSKTEHVISILNNEIDSYIECLFYSSFLEYLAGKKEKSRYWFSQIYFLDNDYNKVLTWLETGSLLKTDQKMREFLNNVNTNKSHYRPNYYKSTFFNFASGLLLNKDIIRWNE